MSSSPHCDSYLPGHNVHWIQWHNGSLTPGRPVHLIGLTDSEASPLVATVRVDGGPEEIWLFHDLPAVRAALAHWEQRVAFLHDLGLLIVGAVGEKSRPCLYPCCSPASWTECATIRSVGSDDPATLLESLGGFVLRPRPRPRAETT